MNTQTDKKHQDKRQSVANSIAQKKNSKVDSKNQFEDNRPSSIVQRKTQELINNSPRLKPIILQQKTFQKKAQTPLKNGSNNTALPDNLKSGIENLSGYSMDDVKVHYNSNKPAQLQAHAYVQGADIHIGSGQEKHLPHEAWHVVQQKQGRVKPTMQLKGKVNVNDDLSLEEEATRMGQKSLQYQLDSNHSVAQRNRMTKLERSSQFKSIVPPSHNLVLQAVWLPQEEGRQVWKPDTAEGLRWYYIEGMEGEPGLMFYNIIDPEMIPANYAEIIDQKKDQPLPHGEWLKMGWGWTPPEKERTESIRDWEAKDDAMFATGLRRYNGMNEEREFQLSEEVQEARNWYFQNYYETQSAPDAVSSKYKYPPEKAVKADLRGLGEYRNQMDLTEGQFVADSNYALEGRGGEMYYDPKTQSPQKMSNSELIYQQWKAAQGINRPNKMTILKRSHVAGPGLPMIKAIMNQADAFTLKTGKFGTSKTYEDRTFTTADRAFYQLLSVPNAIAAIWLVRDHGLELGIKGIQSITVLKKMSLEFHFA